MESTDIFGQHGVREFLEGLHLFQTGLTQVRLQIGEQFFNKPLIEQGLRRGANNICLGLRYMKGGLIDSYCVKAEEAYNAEARRQRETQQRNAQNNQQAQQDQEQELPLDHVVLHAELTHLSDLIDGCLRVLHPMCRPQD